VNLPPDLTVRALVAGEDMTALTELAHACDETYLEWTRPGWMVPIAPPGWADNYLAPDCWLHGAFEPGRRLVGSVAFRPSDEDPAAAHVGLVFVHPARWREGIAASMMALAEAEMQARGYVREQLWTPDGAPAERFYQAQGWTRDGRTTWHPWVGLDLVGYARDLV